MFREQKQNGNRSLYTYSYRLTGFGRGDLLGEKTFGIVSTKRLVGIEFRFISR